jgi:hypothetical protein
VSTATFRWTLLVAASLIAPLPMAGVETAWIPVGRMVLLASIALVVTVTEGTGGVGPLMTALFWGQALLWAAVCWAFAWGFGHVLSAARPGFRQRIAFVLVAILASIAILDPIYTTPYSATSDRSTLAQVYR